MALFRILLTNKWQRDFFFHLGDIIRTTEKGAKLRTMWDSGKKEKPQQHVFFLAYKTGRVGGLTDTVDDVEKALICSNHFKLFNAILFYSIRFF